MTKLPTAEPDSDDRWSAEIATCRCSYLIYRYAGTTGDWLHLSTHLKECKTYA